MADDKSVEKLLAELETRLRHVETARWKVTRENESLREEVAILKAKVKELTARLGLNSSNSSMPPSSDKPWQRPHTKWRPTGRRPGGQPGHEAHARDLFKPEDVDRVVPVLPGRCGKCRRVLRAEDAIGAPLLHQVVDIPPVSAQVTEYQVSHCLCPGCGTVTHGELPKGVSWSIVGVRLQAILAVLTGRCRLSRREAR